MELHFFGRNVVPPFFAPPPLIEGIFIMAAAKENDKTTGEEAKAPFGERVKKALGVTSWLPIIIVIIVVAYAVKKGYLSKVGF